MPFFFIIGYIILFAIISIAAFLVVGGIKTRGSVARGLNMSLFLISLPRETPGQNQRPEKDLIAVMEQLYASFSNLQTKGWNKFVYGDPYVGLELSVHHVGEEIHFYIAVPRSYEQVFEKQVHGLYPTAHIQAVPEYNIFNPKGVALAASVRLKEDAILPFSTYQRLQADPLGEIATALSKLQREGEGASVQLLIRPARGNHVQSLAPKVAREMQVGYKFSDALNRARSKPKKTDKEKENSETRVVTPFEQEVVKAIQGKATKPLFYTNIRLVVSADTLERAQQMLNDVSSSFVQFSAVDMNSLKTETFSGRSLEDLIFKFSFRMFDDKKASTLSSEEVASLFHFPTAYTYAPKIKYLKAKPAEPPPNLANEGIVLGTNNFRGGNATVRMTDSDRRRHLYVIGQTGTGKSTFMEDLIYQDIVNGHGVAFIDPHGTAIDKILGFIPKERENDVIVFDPADTAQPLGLNMLEFDTRFPEQKTFIVNELLGIFQKLFLAETMGPMFDQYFRNAALLLMDDYQYEIPTLVNIPKVLTDVSYRRDKLTRETNPIVKNFWELEAEKAGGDAALANMAPYITSKINGFIANEFLRPILTQKESAFSFRKVMDDRKILLVNLSKGRIGDINANLLGMIIVGKLLMSALSRVDITDESKRADFYLYIDEFQNFTTDSIATILAEARKYRLNLIVAHQFIKQLKDTIRDAIFGNVGSMAVFRVGVDDAEFLKTQFDPVFSPQDLMNIDNFNCYLKMLINNQTARPFNVVVDPPHHSDSDRREALKSLSRLRYGKIKE